MENNTDIHDEIRQETVNIQGDSYETDYVRCYKFLLESGLNVRKPKLVHDPYLDL